MHIMVRNKRKKILAFIPARSGSKGIPGKNITKVGGVPLIAYSVLTGRAAKLVSLTLVSTDSPQIAKIAKKYGAYVPFLRPVELATDKSLTIDAILHCLNWFEGRGENYDAVAVLEPTSPLRHKDDVDNAIKILIKNWNKVDAIVSLGEIQL